jgi:hypothetical protein
MNFRIELPMLAAAAMLFSACGDYFLPDYEHTANPKLPPIEPMVVYESFGTERINLAMTRAQIEDYAGPSVDSISNSASVLYQYLVDNDEENSVVDVIYDKKTGKVVYISFWSDLYLVSYLDSAGKEQPRSRVQFGATSRTIDSVYAGYPKKVSPTSGWLYSTLGVAFSFSEDSTIEFIGVLPRGI